MRSKIYEISGSEEHFLSFRFEVYMIKEKYFNVGNPTRLVANGA